MSFYRKLVLSLMLGEAGPRAVAFAQLALAFRLSWFPLTAASRRDLRWGDDAMRDLRGWKVIQSTEIFASTQSLRPSACASSLSVICFWCFCLRSVVYVCNMSICWCAFIVDVLLLIGLGSRYILFPNAFNLLWTAVTVWSSGCVIYLCSCSIAFASVLSLLYTLRAHLHQIQRTD